MTAHKGDLEETNFFARDCAAAFAGKVKVELPVLRLAGMLAVSNGASPVEDLAVKFHTCCSDEHCDGGGVVWKCEECAADGRGRLQWCVWACRECRS